MAPQLIGNRYLAVPCLNRMMGSWSLDGGGACTHRLLLCALVAIGIWMNTANTSLAQPGAGFLSIDCGYTGPNYEDSASLTWIADNETYIKTGKTFEQPPVDSSEVGNQSLRTFRYFPDGRSKHCYKLPTTPNVSYLLRAGFYMNQSVLAAKRPFQIILSINATDWFTLSSGEDSQSDLHVMEEAIFHSSDGTVVYFCLRPVLGVPFVSSLELRPLEATMYSYSGNERQYLALLFRYNLAVKNTTSPVRFPDDQFDRIWTAYEFNASTSTGVVSYISSPMPPDNTTGADVYYVPPKVMQDAWVMDGILDPAHLLDGRSVIVEDYYEDELAVVFPLYSDYLPVYLSPAQNAFAVIYAENLNLSVSQTYTMDVVINEKFGPSINFSHRASMQANPNLPLSSNTMAIQSDFTPEEDFFPSINAIEVYGQYDFNFSRTDPTDVEAITALKKDLNLTDWEGDPCTPVAYDWLSCTNFEVSNDDYFEDYIAIRQPCGLNLEGTALKYCTVLQETLFLGVTYTVTTLNISNISNSGLEVFTQQSYKSSDIWLKNLNEMIITHSNIDNGALQLLIHNTLTWLWVTRLDLSHNVIADIPDVWYGPGNGGNGGAIYLEYLNLSHNHIGQMSSFENVSFNNVLTVLDLSYNNMSSISPKWNNTLQVLEVLDLSHNNLPGSISSLDYLVQYNSKTLQQLNFSHNNFTGPFNSTLYMSGLPKLTVGNFDQNSIDGMLDLSVWYEALQNEATSNSSAVIHQLFSFVNNSISAIHPNAEAFESQINILKTNYPDFEKNGVLLGGNPYCKGAKSYIQRYLCRYAVNEPVPNGHKNNNYIWKVSLGGGILALLLSSVTFVTLWKLWKQTHALQKLQQELANRKVQPPYYRYGDLKQATREFHKDNKLGEGGFGVVYKGVLEDHTKLAVKKLFNSKNIQVTDEFLNEVMLITGIKHKNLIQLKGCCIEDNQRLLVYEYAENGNLAEALWGSEAHEVLNWEQRLGICMGVARGLSYLHEELQPSIIHRDIKPANVLLDKNFNPKIADFGLARHSSNEASQAHFTRQLAGTLGYWSPEYASEGQLSNKGDVYSYGIVVLEVVSGRKCIDPSLSYDKIYLRNWVHTMHKNRTLLNVLQPELEESCNKLEVIKALKIGLLCIQHDPDRRPSMSQVVTMFSGNMDIEIFLDEPNNVQPWLKDLQITINNDSEHLQHYKIVEEDPADSILLDQDYVSSSSNMSYHTHSTLRSTIELASIVASVEGR